MRSARVVDALSWCRRALPDVEDEFGKTDAWGMFCKTLAQQMCAFV